MDPEAFRGAWGKYVCDRHVEDDWLASWVRSNASSNACDYCDAPGEEDFAADVGELTEVVLAGLHRAYNQADDEGLPYDSRDGGYQLAEPMSGVDLLSDEGPFNDATLVEDVASGFPHDLWVQRDFYRLSPFHRLRSSWESFVELIKHRSRFFFGFTAPGTDDPDEITPADFLVFVAAALKESAAIHTLGAGAVVYRARTHKEDERLSRAGQLGTAPVEYANAANRMSPAGIPMFYGAYDPDTAREEAISADPDHLPRVTVGAFKTLRGLRVVDLTRPISVPSLYDPELGHRRGSLAFLRSFLHELSLPITRDKSEHIEYVPTQVITEYFRSALHVDADGPIDGIVYPSTRRADGVDVALFILNVDAVNGDGSRDLDAPMFGFEPAVIELQSSEESATGA